MTRRGKRRRGRGRSAPQKQTDVAAQPQSRGQTQATGRRRRRRGGRRKPITVDSALQEMAGRRPDRAQTLPPDGLVLEDLISTMQNEYGTPTTPQEYKLVLRVAEDSPAAGIKRTEDVADAKGTRLRRRRRREMPPMERSPEEIPTEPEDPQEIPPVI